MLLSETFHHQFLCSRNNQFLFNWASLTGAWLVAYSSGAYLHVLFPNNVYYLLLLLILKDVSKEGDA